MQLCIRDGQVKGAWQGDGERLQGKSVLGRGGRLLLLLLLLLLLCSVVAGKALQGCWGGSEKCMGLKCQGVTGGGGRAEVQQHGVAVHIGGLAAIGTGAGGSSSSGCGCCSGIFAPATSTRSPGGRRGGSCRG